MQLLTLKMIVQCSMSVICTFLMTSLYSFPTILCLLSANAIVPKDMLTLQYIVFDDSVHVFLFFSSTFDLMQFFSAANFSFPLPGILELLQFRLCLQKVSNLWGLCYAEQIM